MSSSWTNGDSSDSYANDAPHSLLLSMKNDHFKSIIYRHFRILGMKRDRDNDDKDREDCEARRVLEELIQSVGNGVHERLFYEELKVDRPLHGFREKALEFIRDAIKNRDETSHLWLIHDETTESELLQSMSVEKEPGKIELNVPPEIDNEYGQTLNRTQSTLAIGESIGTAEVATETTKAKYLNKSIPMTRKNEKSPQTESDDNDETLASLAASKRKAPGMTLKTITNNTNKRQKPRSTDIQLSMMDPYYRQVIFHYYQTQMNKTYPSKKSQIAVEIYNTFQKKLLDSGGKFYKVAFRGGDWYVIESEEDIIKKIKRDLNKTRLHQNKMNSTLVLDLERNVKYARIMYKYYNILGLERDDARENDIAGKVLKELKENYDFFVRTSDDERVEVHDDGIVRNLILEAIRRRGECKSLWFDVEVSKIDFQTVPLERPRRSSVHYAAAGQNPSSLQIFLRRKASTQPLPKDKANPVKKLLPKLDQSDIKKRTWSKVPPPRNPISFPLKDRLPPRKYITITARTPIETVSQLVQIVQLTTHNLNELHGTSRRHCKVVRLYDLVEFGGERSGVPTLAELSKHMGTTRSKIRKWFEMCLNAEKREFDFGKYRNDKLDLHSSVFEGGKAEDDIFLVRGCGETALDKYFNLFVRNAMEEVSNRGVIVIAGGESCDKANDSENKLEGEMKAEMPAETGVSVQETNPHVKEDRVISLVIHKRNEVGERAREENGFGQHETDQTDIKAFYDRVCESSGDVSQLKSFLNENDVSVVLNRNEEVSLHLVDTESFTEGTENDAENVIFTAVQEPDTPALDSTDQTSHSLEDNISDASISECDHKVVAKDHNALEKVEKSNSNSLEPPLFDLDTSAGNQEFETTHGNEDVNASYNEAKHSIIQISNAIGGTTELQKAIVSHVGAGQEDSDQLSTVGSPMHSQISSALDLDCLVDEGTKGPGVRNLPNSTLLPDVANDKSAFISNDGEYQLSPVASTKSEGSVQGNTGNTNPDATQIDDNSGMEQNLSPCWDNDHINARVNEPILQGVLLPAADPRQCVKVLDTNSPDSRTRNDNLQPLLCKIKRGSPVAVKWGSDHDLSKATVIKVLYDRDEPASHVHCDGKKSHIVDKTGLEMIEGLIADDEKNSQDNNASHTHDTIRSEKAPIRELLQGKYQVTFPFDKFEHREQCPELGAGWTIYIAVRKNQHASQNRKRIRADRYFISPSGKPCRSVSAVEKYFIEHPEEFDLSSTEKSGRHNKNDGESVPIPCDGRNKATTLENGTYPKRDQESEEPRALLPGYRDADHQNSTAFAWKESENNDLRTEHFSPLLMGHSTQAIEDNHCDHEFLTSLMDERGFLFGDEGMENDTSSRSRGQFETSNVAATDTIETLSLKPMKTCVKCLAPDPERKVVDLKKVVDYADDSDAPQQEKIALKDEDKKKVLSPRTKHNKKSLIAGIVPVFAMDIPAGAEFTGYLGDAHRDDDSDDASNEEVSLISRASRTHAHDFVSRKAVCQLRNQEDIVSPITALKPSHISSFVRISPIVHHGNTEKVLNITDFNEGLHNYESGRVTSPSYVGLPKGNEFAVAADSTEEFEGSLHGTASSLHVQEPNFREAEDSERGDDSQHKNIIQVNLAKPLSDMKCASSQNEGVVSNTKLSPPALVAAQKVKKPGLVPPVFPPSSRHVSSEPSPSGNIQLFAFKYDSEDAREPTTRPKRKLKSTVRFDPEMTDTQAHICKTGHGFICPRCKFVCEYDSKLCTGCRLECYYEAGVGVVVLKERASVGAEQSIPPMAKRPNAFSSNRSRSDVLCNCTYCGRHHFSIQGIRAHHGRCHQLHGKLDWSNITFSCPFCKSSQTFTLEEVERHVSEHHPGSELVTPKTSRSSRFGSRSKVEVSPPQSSLHPHKLRIPRTKKPPCERKSASDVHSLKVTPMWTTLDYRSLLPDCKKEYPRDICSLLDLVDEQCKAQAELLETAREQRLKLCRTEAEIEAKAWEDDRLAYQRGIRERSRYADGERIEKQSFIESHKLSLMLYEYENRNRKRTRNEIEADKLCSKPIVFSSGKGRNLPQERVLCNDENCELCKNDSTYLQSVMLDSEMASFRKDQPSSQSLHPEVNLLNPTFCEMTENYLAEAEHLFEDEARGANSLGGRHEGNRKSNNSRRNIATIKRLRIEEDKLFEMRRIQHGLNFVSRYNEGLITGAWNEYNNETGVRQKKPLFL